MRRWGLWDALRSWGWTGVVNGISVPNKETPQSFLTPSTTWGHSGKVPSRNQKVGSLTKHQICQCVDLRLPRIVGNEFLLRIIYLVSGTLLQQPEWTKKISPQGRGETFLLPFWTLSWVWDSVQPPPGSDGARPVPWLSVPRKHGNRNSSKGWINKPAKLKNFYSPCENSWTLAILQMREL